jgi:hypothetical protein
MVGEMLMALVAPSLLCALYLGPWQWAWADHARQSVFEQRDAIFDIAHAGDLEFGSDPYVTVRAGMNCLIRFAHRATVPRLLFHYLLRRPSVPELGRVQQAIMTIENEGVRKRVWQHVEQAEQAFVASIVARSIITFSLLFLVLWLVATYRRIVGYPIRSFSEAMARARSVVQAEANAICA